MAKLRLAILGTGVAARELYLPAWGRLQHKIELVACANRTHTKAEDYARLAGIPNVVRSASELFRRDDVDAVLISLPIDQQPKYVLQALQAGKAVLSEKPVAPSVASGRRLLQRAAAYPSPWLVGENFRFLPQVDRLQSWVQSGRLGEVRLVEVMQLTKMDEENPYYHTAWRAQPKHQGAFVVDAGVHLADVVLRCFGMPKRIRSLSAHLDSGLPGPDTAVAALAFDSGALGTWSSCFATHYDGPMLRVWGSRATVELYWDRVSLRDHKGRERLFQTNVDSFQAQFAHFADVVTKGLPLAITPEEALQDLELMQAIVKKR